MRQPDDPGPLDAGSNIPGRGTPDWADRASIHERPTGYYERQARLLNKRERRILRLYVFVFAVIVMTVVAWRNAGAQDPPVPLEQPCPSGDCTVYNQAVIYALTGNERTIRWTLGQVCVDTMDLFTEITVFEFPPKAIAFPVMRAELPEIERTIGWTPNRAGTYFVKARSCRTDIPQDGEPIEDENNPGQFDDPELRRGTLDEWILCSITVESLDPAHTDPAVYPRGFFMLIKLAPATGGGIS